MGRTAQHTDDRAGAITPNAAKLNGLANNRRILPERVRPETIGEDNDTGSLGTVIFGSNQTPEHRTQSHDIEIGSVDHAAIDFARLAQPKNGEGDGREVTKCAQAFDFCLQVLEFPASTRCCFRYARLAHSAGYKSTGPHRD